MTEDNNTENTESFADKASSFLKSNSKSEWLATYKSWWNQGLAALTNDGERDLLVGFIAGIVFVLLFCYLFKFTLFLVVMTSLAGLVIWLLAEEDSPELVAELAAERAKTDPTKIESPTKPKKSASTKSAPKKSTSKKVTKANSSSKSAVKKSGSKTKKKATTRKASTKKTTGKKATKKATSKKSATSKGKKKTKNS